jgi:hypothetical protein
MIALRLGLAAALALAPLPACAGELLSTPQIDGTGAVKLGRLRLGKWQSNKFIAQPDNMQSAATTSPLDTDVYASGFATGKAAHTFVSGDDNASTGLERYGAWIAYTGAGTGDPAVISSTFGAGISNLKKNWYNTTNPGQIVGLHITTRGGYHGALENTAPAEYGGYYPGGDMTNIIINSVQSSAYAQQAAAEWSIHYAKDGIFDAAHDVHSINVQIAPMRQKNPDGTPNNPGTGISLTASAGSLSYAYQAVNTARPGSYNNGTPGIWGGFARYNLDDGGTRAPFDAFAVDQQGWIRMSSGYATTPKKTLRVGTGGLLEVLNDAGTPVVSISDSGNLYLGASQGVWTAYTPAPTFDSGSTATATAAARYTIVGKTMFVNGTYAITAVGGAPGFGLFIPLPSGAILVAGCAGSGSEYGGASGKGLNVGANGAATSLTITNMDNTSAIAATAQGRFSATCEIQ